MFAKLISTLKKSPKTIVFTEGTDPRILEASARLLSSSFLKPVLIGNPDEIAAAAEASTFAAPRSSILKTTRAWTRWSRRWSSCARAR